MLAAKRRSTLPAQAFHTPPRDLLVWASSLKTILLAPTKWCCMGAKPWRGVCVMQGCRALLASGRFTQNPSSLPNGSRAHQWISLAGTSSWPANTGLKPSPRSPTVASSARSHPEKGQGPQTTGDQKFPIRGSWTLPTEQQWWLAMEQA